MASPITPSASSQPSRASSVYAARAGYNVALGYLRGFLVILVLAHHSAIAYMDYIPPQAASLEGGRRFWRAFPVVDPNHHSLFFTFFTGFNDTFFMALMFFVSGLFVWSSVQRKGNHAFVRERMKRLGIPFLFAAAIVAPLAYYPAYLLTGAHGVAGYVHAWLSFGDWPTGPAWFIWLLLAFDLAAAAVFAVAPNLGGTLARLAANAREHPAGFFAMFVAASVAAYVPMVAVFGSTAWTSIGPFQFQTARLFHYAVYFSGGIGVGAYGIEGGLLASDGALARHWGRWTLFMLAVFAMSVGFVLIAISKSSPMSPRVGNIVGGFVFALTCASISFAFMAIFVRWMSRRNRLFDSLSDNEYGMYLIHYMFVSWLQFALLAAPLGAFEKATLVFSGVLLMSWGTSATLRRIPAIRRTV